MLLTKLLLEPEEELMSWCWSVKSSKTTRPYIWTVSCLLVTMFLAPSIHATGKTANIEHIAPLPVAFDPSASWSTRLSNMFFSEVVWSTSSNHIKSEIALKALEQSCEESAKALNRLLKSELSKLFEIFWAQYLSQGNTATSETTAL